VPVNQYINTRPLYRPTASAFPAACGGEFQQKSISLEKALRGIGYHKRNLYPRHLERTFKTAVNDGKALRIQFKKLA